MRLLLCAIAYVLAVASASAQEPGGEWLVADGNARVRIVECDGNALWGVVSWEKVPGGRDTYNPDPTKRSRLTLGMPILLDMRPARPGRWEGQVYNAQNGQTYQSSIMLRDPNTLRIEGCVLGFLCGGQDWSRAISATSSRPAPAEPPDAKVCSRILDPSGRPH